MTGGKLFHAAKGRDFKYLCKVFPLLLVVEISDFEKYLINSRNYSNRKQLVLKLLFVR